MFGRNRIALGKLATVLVLLAGLVGSCTDAPSGPAGVGPTQLVLSPQLSFGNLESASTSALSAAFDLVNTFRLEVWRVSDGAKVADVQTTVTPGQNAYDLAVSVTVQTPGELFSVVITALQDGQVLFQSAPIQVSATSGGGAAQPVTVLLAYAGPGSSATSAEFAESSLVLAPNGTGALSARVLDGAGSALTDVPLIWLASNPAVATVSSDGGVSANGPGVASISFTTPTGLSATAWVYVVSGELAFVRDGHVHQVPVAGSSSTDLTPGAQTAQGPAWEGDGSRLFYSDQGELAQVGTGSLGIPGTWPSLSPDGTLLAFEREGTIFFANPDGSHPTQGPSGTTPVWAGEGLYLFAGGGSVHRLNADGTDRTVVAAGGVDRLPAVSATGMFAFLSGSEGQIWTADPSGQPRTPLLPAGQGAASRPTWSPDGGILAYGGADGLLYVVAADGSAPPAALPVGPGTDPSWMEAGPVASPEAVVLGELVPVNPAPGSVVEIHGAGFDVIIPANNKVFFPGPEGSVEGEVLTVLGAKITAQVPSEVTSGNLRVVSRGGEETVPFEPATGPLVILARTTEGDPLDGVAVQVQLDGTVVASGTTNA